MSASDRRRLSRILIAYASVAVSATLIAVLIESQFIEALATVAAIVILARYYGRRNPLP